MTAGRKRYRITIQRLKTNAEGLARAASGKIDHTLGSNWKTHATRWAEIHPLGGGESQQEGQVRSAATHLVTVEWDSATRQTTTDMRVAWPDGGTTRLLQITRATGEPRGAGGPRRDLVLECKEHT